MRNARLARSHFAFSPRRLRFWLATAFVAAFASAEAWAAPNTTAGSLTVEDAWARTTPGGATVAAGYLRITNGGDAADRLVSASSPAAGRVEVHATTVDDAGVMKMREVTGGLEIKAGETVEFKPGGLHLMFLDIKAPFKEGDATPVTLKFEKAGEAAVDFAVKPAGASSGSHHGHH